MESAGRGIRFELEQQPNGEWWLRIRSATNGSILFTSHESHKRRRTQENNLDLLRRHAADAPLTVIRKDGSRTEFNHS